MQERTAWTWPDWLLPLEPVLWVLVGALLLYLLWEVAILLASVCLWIAQRVRPGGWKRGRPGARSGGREDA